LAVRGLQRPALLALAAAAIMVPIFAAQRADSVTHPEWAGMLVDALELERGVPEPATPARLFSALSWKGSLVFGAADAARTTGVALDAAGDATVAVAREAEGELAFPLGVVTAGDYRVRARLSGDPARPAAVELVPAGETAAAGDLALALLPALGWVEGGALHLDRGAHTAIVRLPGGAAFESIEFAPPCLAPVEPLRGWSAEWTADAVDVAVTAVKAVDAESELPAAADPVEAAADDVGAGGAQVVLDLPVAGLYTISAYGTTGAGQGWLADACRKAVVCPPRDPREAARADWRPVLTAPFDAGRHTFAVTLRAGAAVTRARAELKRNSGADYVETLRRLGLDVGEGLVSRATAEEAKALVERRTAEILAGRCGDLVRPDGLRDAGPQSAAFAQPGAAPEFPAIQPIGDPRIPLTPAPSASPLPSPSPSPSAPPPSPLPTPIPTPTPPASPTPAPIPTQPPGSAVVPVASPAP
jgi:hypothetical protein